MLLHLTAYIATAFVFFAIDYVWLSQVAKRFYFVHLDGLLLDTPRMGAAGLFYMAYVAGIVIFAVAPALKADSFTMALTYGALFGMFAYATYDMTNYATLRDWPLIVVVVDITWGTLLTGVSAAAGFWLTKAVLPSA